MSHSTAALHSATVNDIYKNRFKSIKYEHWWNTYQIRNHFDQIFHLMRSRAFPGRLENILKQLKINETALDNEIAFVEGILQDRDPRTAIHLATVQQMAR